MNRARQASAALILRPRIQERLTTAASYPITTVIAPAGFGKTTAVRSFLMQAENAVLVSTPHAAGLGQFVQTFARACSTSIPEMDSPPHESISDNNDVEGSVDIYAAWAAVNLHNAHRIICVDDLQHADEHPAVGMFLSRLADITKDRVKWVFCSRTRGHLPLPRWQAYGDADDPITADDLRMTIEEAATLAKSSNSPATREQIRMWVDQTRGFPVPLAYAIRLSAKRGSPIDIMDGTRSFTFGFLADQLWSTLSRNEQVLIEIAAFLPPIHMHAYENAGWQKASSIISNLCDDITFLTLTQNGIFSMHELFRDFVRVQVLRSGPDAQRRCCNEAVNILITAGYYSEALGLRIEAGDTQNLITTVEKFARSINDDSMTQRVVSATEHIPPAQLGLETLCLQTEYWSWFGESRKSLMHAEEIIRRSDSTADHLLHALRSIYRSCFESQAPHKLRDWLDQMPRVLGRFAESETTQAHAYHASLLALLPEKSAEAQFLIQQTLRNITALNPFAQIDVQLVLSTALYYLGDHASALQAAREGAELARAMKSTREIARSLNNLGLLLVYAYESDVESVFEPLREAVERTGAWRFGVVSHWIPAVYYAWKGDVERSIESFELQLAAVPTQASLKSYLKASQRHSRNLCRLIEEEYQAIVEEFTVNGLPKEPDVAYEILTDVAAAFAFTSRIFEYENTLKTLQRVRESLPTSFAISNRQAVSVEIISLCIMGHWSQARRLNEQCRGSTPGLALFEEALTRFCQGPPFIGISGLVDRCLGKPYIGLCGALMKRVLETKKLETTTLLTTAEMEVLHLIAAGKSSKEIANARSRSVETVNRQVASIFKKLGVENRTSAVAVARERGIL